MKPEKAAEGRRLLDAAKAPRSVWSDQDLRYWLWDNRDELVRYAEQAADHPVPEVIEKLRTEASLLDDLKALNAWRKRDRLIRQWILGSRFGKVHVRLQSQGDDLVAPFVADTDEGALALAAAWARENQ